jgi:hypothetical protein
MTPIETLAQPGARPTGGIAVLGSPARDLVILACAASAGIHGALAPEHFREGAGAGIGFVVATVLLGAIAVGMSVRPESRTTVVAAAVVLAGLLASYGLAVTVGMPVVHPAPEPVEGLAVATKLVEGAGLFAAAYVVTRAGRSLSPRAHRQKGTFR